LWSITKLMSGNIRRKGYQKRLISNTFGERNRKVEAEKNRGKASKRFLNSQERWTLERAKIDSWVNY